ncbi:MAG: sporulation transcriptional regulator SpoIIID [Clostridia bacterium]|nr:sporulation transcriptional regulator SpoIIID [Clostridia bacterium]
MKDYIEERAIELANYIIENTSTVRETAKRFAMSKSSVHKDVTDRLSKINPRLAEKTKAVLDYNKAERHIRGGMATKHKYAELRAKKRQSL